MKAAAAKRLKTIQSWALTKEDYENLIAENPHVYSPVSGFHAEYKCRQFYLDDERISNIIKPTGYDKKEKGDFVFTYRGKIVRLEVKSLDGPRVVSLGKDKWKGTFQCNASDARAVTLPNGNEVQTNCIVTGGWDVLAVNTYDFGGNWRFAFALQDDLPRASSLYSSEDRQFLLASSMTIEYPFSEPYSGDLYAKLDSFLHHR